MFETILHFGITALLGYMSEYNYLFKMITLDSLFGAMHFMHRFIDHRLTESQVISESNSLYHGTVLDRYIYYIMLYFIYKTFNYFFWIHSHNISFIFYYIGLFSIVPIIINKILQSRLFEIIRQKKEMFVKTVIAKTLTSMIKFCSRVYLNKEIDLEYTEIMVVLKDYMETVSYFLTVLKSLLIILGLSYVKNYAPSMYYGAIKYIYNYKTGELITSYNYESAKHYISDIIDNKKWNELSKANTFKAILYLYQMNTDKSDLFEKIVNDFNLALIKMFSIWTISSLISNIYLAPILSLGLLLYKRYVRKSPDDLFIGEIGLIVLSAIIGHFYSSYFLISFIGQFGPKILFNSFIYIIIGILVKSVKDLGFSILNNNKNTTISFFIVIAYITSLRLFKLDSYTLIGTNILANILMGNQVKKQIIFAIILSSTFLSNFAFTHVLFNSTILYLLFGLFNFCGDTTYTIQDLLKNVLDIVRPNVNLAYNEIYMYRTKLYNCCKKKQKINQIVFDILDTNKYPSVSQLGQKIEKKEDIKDSSSMGDSVSIDNPIFDQPDDIFINEISITSSTSTYFVKSSHGKIDVINDFLL